MSITSQMVLREDKKKTDVTVARMSNGMTNYTLRRAYGFALAI